MHGFFAKYRLALDIRVFGAGVFEMRTLNFMLAVFVGRCIRFGVETALVVKYGPEIVTVVADLAKRHLAVTLLGLVVIFGGLGWWIWGKMRTKRLDSASEAL